MPVGRVVDRLDHVERHRRAGGVVRRAEEDDVGCGIGDLGCRALGIDREVVARACPRSSSAPVACVSSGYIEYVGAKPNAVRPGPAKACRTCCSTSLEPFAAQICSRVSP